MMKMVVLTCVLAMATFVPSADALGLGNRIPQSKDVTPLDGPDPDLAFAARREPSKQIAEMSEALSASGDSFTQADSIVRARTDTIGRARLSKRFNRIVEGEDKLFRLEGSRPEYNGDDDALDDAPRGPDATDPETLEKYRKKLDEEAGKLIEKHQAEGASADSVARLMTALKATSSGAEIAAFQYASDQSKIVLMDNIAQDAKLVLDDLRAGRSLSLSDAIASLDKIVLEFADGMTPGEEIEKTAELYGQAIVIKFQRLIDAGDWDGAAKVFTDNPGIKEFMTNDQLGTINDTILSGAAGQEGCGNRRAGEGRRG